MKTRTSAAVAVALLAAGAVVAAGTTSAAGTTTAAANARPHHVTLSQAFLHAHFRTQSSCATVSPPGFARCFAQHLVPKDAKASAATTGSNAISGLTPANVQSAYKVTGRTTTRTVAIVDANGYPRAAADLATYRAQWGLPACTTASGCLRIVNQTGGTALPRFDAGWAQEQALDLDAVSATCPACKILLVQAKSSAMADLGTAVNTAAARGVAAISNSYGTTGDAPDSTFARYYQHSGTAVTASAGDNGFQRASYPASSHYVTAVGGTHLVKSATSRGWSETVWSGTGSGCSIYNTAPVGQSSTVTHCAKRAMNDVAAVADPNTGLAVYAPSSTTSSWEQFGGTSLSSPIIASVYALSGNVSGYPNHLPYSHPADLFDVTSGHNGTCANFCTARSGWDGPTGLGTPNGTGAF
jgi:subtilase family serine protease